MTTRTRAAVPASGVDDADLVVDQVHLAEARDSALEGLAQGGVEGVDRAVALAHGVLDVVADPELDRRLGQRRRRRASVSTLTW